MYITPPTGPVPTDAAPVASPPAAAACRADPDARQRLVSALNNPSHTFGPDESLALVTLLSHAFESLRRWQAVPTLVWCEGGERFGAGEMDRPPYLLLAPSGTEQRRELHAAVLHELYPGQASLPAHLPPGNKFATPPLDAFDVVAEMLRRAMPPASWQGQRLGDERGSMRAGMPWRYALAQFLDTSEGRRLDVNACLLPVGGDRPVAVKSLAAQTPARSQRLLDLLQSRPAPDSRPVPADASNALPAPIHTIAPSARTSPGRMNIYRLHETHAMRVNELARLVESGGWADVLDRVAPQLLVRLPQRHPMCVGGLRVLLGDGTLMRFGPYLFTSRQLQLRFDPDSDRVDVEYLPGRDRTATFTGPDSHLAALIPLSSGAPAWSVEQARTLLVQLIERAPVMTALCLEIYRRWPECDPETMLRFCLHGSSIQRTGQQLLDPDAPQRDVKAMDVHRWHLSEGGRGSCQRDIEAQGISLAHARWHFGPLNPTRAGQDLMYQSGLFMRPPPDAEERFRREQFQARLPQLLYEFDSWHLMADFLARGHSTLMALVSPDVAQRARTIASRLKRESLLPMPTHQSSDAPRPGPGKAQGQ